ncbi:MAG: pitrilysin family protein [Dehalococcoidales bacterium]|nr:pitrilysin family protein [Dehalococcoidales bacterium]
MNGDDWGHYPIDTFYVISDRIVGNILRGEILYQKTVLEDGLRVVTDTMPYTRSVSICIFVGVGSRYEKNSVAGISHFIEHLLFRGTEKRPESRIISGAIEGVGGILNGGTDREVTVYWCKVPRNHFLSAMDVLTDMLLHSRFDPGDMEKERQIIIEEISMSHDSPDMWVNHLIDRLLWYGNPLGRDVAGDKKTVSAITREAILDYMQLGYLPANTVVAVAGNIEHQEVVEVVSRSLVGWEAVSRPNKYQAYEQNNCPPVKIEKRKIEQAHLCLALPGLSLFHPARFHMDLLNMVLGEGMSSRLFTEVRDKLGLAYTISSYTEHLADTGSMIIYAGVEPKKLSTAISVIVEQLASFKEKEVSEAELTKAKEMSRGRLLLRMEDSRSVASWMGSQEILTNKILSVEEVVSIIDAITAPEICRIASELMVSDRLRLAVVGPIDKSEPLEALLRL